MVYPASEILILKDEEFLLLLAASGLENWYGMELSGRQEVLNDIRAFNTSLAALYQKQIIEWDGDKARIAEGYKDMFRTLRDAVKCILVRTEARPGYVSGCYPAGGRVVSVTRGVTAQKEVELSMQSAGEWLAELETSGCLPDIAADPGKDEEVFGAEEILSEFELRSVPEGRLLQTMKICEQGLYITLEIEEEGKVRRDLYSRESFESLMAGWCGGMA